MYSFSSVMQTILNGFITGSSYALVGAGLSLVWGVLKMVNIAHGEFYMLGGYLLHTFLQVLGVPVLPSIIISVLVVAIATGAMEAAIIQPMVDKPNWERTPFLLTLGVSVFFQNFALLVWGERYLSVPYINSEVFNIGGVRMLGHRIIILVVAVVAIMGLMLFVKYTKTGNAIRATSQNKLATNLMGISVKRIFLITYAISGALAALAGTLLSPIYGINPVIGSTVQTKGLVVCVLGGLGSLEGAIIGGILLGVIENLTIMVLASEWKDVAAYILLLLVLWLKPTGLFGKREG